MDTKPCRKIHGVLVAIATVTPVFSVVLFLSTLEKALLAAIVFGATWIAVSERWHERGRRGFWGLVGLFSLLNAVAIWTPPVAGPFKAGLAVAYTVGIAEGFLLYWLLGRLI